MAPYTSSGRRRYGNCDRQRDGVRILNPNARPASEQDDTSGLLLEQLRTLWKHRWIVLSGIALALCLDALWVLRQPKIFAAMSTLQFEPNPPRPLGRQVEDVDTSGTASYWNLREYYETQYRVIRSRGVAEGVVRRLGLQHDPDFMNVQPERRQGWRSVSVTDAANALIARTVVAPVKESRLVNITVEDRSPRRAQLLANTIADVYIQRNLDLRLGSTRDAVRWLSNQLDELRENLSHSEDRLQQYRLQHNIVSDTFSDQRNILGNRIARLSEALTDAQTRRFNLSARVGEVQRASSSVVAALPTPGMATQGAALDSTVTERQDWTQRTVRALSQLTAPEFLASVVLTSLRTQFEVASREEAALEPRYLPSAVELRTARARTNTVAALLRAEVQNIKGSAEAEQRGVMRAEGNIRAELLNAQREAVHLNEQETVYSRLSRERENHAKIYGIVLERATEGNLMQELRVNNMRVLDYALVPTAAVKPRVGLTLALGAVVGLGVGILAALIAIQLDRTVRSQQDIEETLRATFLGYMPFISSRGIRAHKRYQYGDAASNEAPIENYDLVVHSHPASVVAELARSIRTNLLFMSPDKPYQALIVTSASPREGKTFTATSLAISLAQSGKKVCLVDGDLRRPRVHKIFGVRPPVGLTSILIGETQLDETVIHTEVPNLDLLACGPIPPNPAELIHSQRMTDLMATLRQRYDRIIVDSPPVTAVTDALALGPQLDGVILVVRARYTRRDQGAAVVRQLRDLGSTLVGVVLNAVDLREEVPTYYYGKYDYSPSPNEPTTTSAKN
jgi:polysaccharide biosynthesis transport protein